LSRSRELVEPEPGAGLAEVGQAGRLGLTAAHLGRGRPEARSPLPPARSGAPAITCASPPSDFNVIAGPELSLQ